jgi:hypothetical protein
LVIRAGRFEKQQTAGAAVRHLLSIDRQVAKKGSRSLNVLVSSPSTAGAT